MKVRELMTTEVVTVQPQTPLKDVAELLVKSDITGLPVVSGEGEVLGVVSERDILFKERGARARGGLLGWVLAPREQDMLKIEALTAGDAMTMPAVTIRPGRAASDAAAMMLDRGVNRLPVVEDGRLIGIVTRSDLVRAFVRPDEEIEKEIREDVILRTLWTAPERVHVTVVRGAVRLTGQVETQEIADLLVEFVDRLPGVVSVESQLSWAGRSDPPARLRTESLLL